ncbi:hypothetical protein [Gordonia sp. (in: high G+C Gram-positive bacteria)]|uniref:hypothetical protein n=1 Tax=Gordonia sp. (in: high G+C Gram-positive bacteria) TaxID=84139 RepID=UPI001DCDB9A9|nr:hypothetical protein [Gordonia sp. (in: high G+C Gram-positive bacteria)]MCB1294592.1 hypothetical protein [Gordonia sp. (in: high G+C Gram-positive bacteria)]HMS76207.1 hypothetical protein [Gordonia sp. (in: high G+C Gram-positive bacteria)]
MPEARVDDRAAGFFAVPFRRAGVLSVSSARPRVDEALFPRDVRAADDRPPVDRPAAVSVAGVRAEDAREPVLALEAMRTE